MAKVITCDCGYIVRGDNDAELLSNARKHVEEAHPDLVGSITDDQFLAMAQEIA